MRTLPEKLYYILFLLSRWILINAKDTSFDVFILTQHWPLTTCMGWRDRSHSNTCKLPDHVTWTLHGLWPTRLGEIAPNYCNDSAHFDPTVLNPIKSDMDQYWPDVEIRKKKNSLWEHEWIKHGTCAAQMKELDSELKYFSKGCEMGKANPLYDWLSSANVVPGNSYNMATVWKAVIEGTKGKRPHIDCDYIEGKHYISEIKICFSKTFEMVDCDGIKQSPGSKDDYMGTCPRHQDFVYPDGTENLLGSLTSRSGIIGGTLGTLVILIMIIVIVAMLWRNGQYVRTRLAYEAL